MVVLVGRDEFGPGAIAAQIADKAFSWLDAPVKRYALPEMPIMSFATSMEDAMYPTPGSIAERARSVVEF